MFIPTIIMQTTLLMQQQMNNAEEMRRAAMLRHIGKNEIPPNVMAKRCYYCKDIQGSFYCQNCGGNGK